MVVALSPLIGIVFYMECPDVKSGDVAIVSAMVEKVVEDPMLEVNVLESSRVVPDTQTVSPERRSPSDVGKLMDFPEGFVSLGSMGIPDDIDESIDESQVKLFLLSSPNVQRCVRFAYFVYGLCVTLVVIVMSFVYVTFHNQEREELNERVNREDIDRVPPNSSRRWLNVVLDLNGILCACVPVWKEHGVKNTDLRVHSPTIPTQVGRKLVRVRPHCADFLLALSRFATITIWSSMMSSTTTEICDYLFLPIKPVQPIRILGQEECDRIPIRSDGHQTLYMTEVGTQKHIFLKTLSKHLFNSFGGLYSSANTLVIDDSPVKHMLNLSENVLLLPSWSWDSISGEADNVLMVKLLPYLENLHQFSGSLADYRSSHVAGRPMYYDDRETCNHYAVVVNLLADRERKSHSSRPSPS